MVIIEDGLCQEGNCDGAGKKAAGWSLRELGKAKNGDTQLEVQKGVIEG
jgi:hypothetical protein